MRRDDPAASLKQFTRTICYAIFNSNLGKRGRRGDDDLSTAGAPRPHRNGEVGRGGTSGQARSKPGPSACTSRPTNVANHPIAAHPIPNPDTPNLANPRLVGDRKRRHRRTWARNTSVRAKGNTHSHKRVRRSRSHILDSTKQTQDPKSRR